jgi:hypothetical protein
MLQKSFYETNESYLPVKKLPKFYYSKSFYGKTFILCKRYQLCLFIVEKCKINFLFGLRFDSAKNAQIVVEL